MTKDRERWITSLVQDWARPDARRKCPDLVIAAPEMARGWITTYDLPGDEISFLFSVMFSLLTGLAFAEGVDAGRDLERAENPLIRSPGEVIATARKAERADTLRVLRETFDALAGTGKVNAFFAFNEAVTAAGSCPPDNKSNTRKTTT